MQLAFFNDIEQVAGGTIGCLVLTIALSIGFECSWLVSVTLPNVDAVYGYGCDRSIIRGMGSWGVIVFLVYIMLVSVLCTAD